MTPSKETNNSNNPLKNEIYELSYKESRIIILKKFSELYENIYRQLNEIRKTAHEHMNST